MKLMLASKGPQDSSHVLGSIDMRTLLSPAAVMGIKALRCLGLLDSVQVATWLVSPVHHMHVARGALKCHVLEPETSKTRRPFPQLQKTEARNSRSRTG